MRIVVAGTSGCGKTTMARRLSHSLGLPHIELDAINWQAGWRDLNTHDPDEFVRRVEAAIAAPAWIADGNYGRVRPLVWARASHLVWLDYPRWRIMSRVIRRSLARALDRRELWPGTGNRESMRNWLKPDHPIRWAWNTAKRRRRDYANYVRDPANAHLTLFHVHRPLEAEAAFAALKRDRETEMTQTGAS